MKKFFAEFIGTFVLVLFACGTATVLGCATDSPDVAYALTAVAFGLVIVAMAYSIGNVSAVTSTLLFLSAFCCPAA